MQIRQPIVTGSFYPSESAELSSKVNEFFNQVDLEDNSGIPSILLVPHAGYSFSGQVAAYGYRTLIGKDIRRVILIGNSHQGHFYQAAAYPEGYWLTPLGKIRVDETITRELLKEQSLITDDIQIHTLEHSLEVQLPFLQIALSNFKIVPILVGNNNKDKAKKLAAAITPYLNKETILIISTDLCHYPPYDVANKVDRRTVEDIISLDVERLEASIKTCTTHGFPNLDCCVCAEGAVKTGMYSAKTINAIKPRLFTYANSGDLNGDKNRVVGYASIGFYK